MKLIFLCVFMTTQSFSRELNLLERNSIRNLEKTMNVHEFALSGIDKKKLSVKDYLSFSFLKKSCNAVNTKVAEILDSSEEENLKNQSRSLTKGMDSCAHGVVGLMSLVLQYSE